MGVGGIYAGVLRMSSQRYQDVVYLNVNVL